MYMTFAVFLELLLLDLHFMNWFASLAVHSGFLDYIFMTSLLPSVLALTCFTLHMGPANQSNFFPFF